MKIVEDMANQATKHLLKHKYWDKNGIEYIRLPLPVGDYIALNDKVQDVIDRKAKRGIEVKKMDLLGTYNLVVDTKRDIQEVVGNVCGKQHARFRDECILAQNNGIKLIVLIENYENINELSELVKWLNPRSARYNKIKCLHSQGKWLNVPLPKAEPTTGLTLMKALYTMQKKYGVEFQFCSPGMAGRKVIELLGGKENE